jgi:ribosomal protein S6--L-glutamate ligase
MRICLLTDKPDHPLLVEVTALLTRHHRVRCVDPDAADHEAAARAEAADPADVYLLKAHTPRALALARLLEERGARVVNSAAATGLCQDRLRTAQRMADAGLPFPRTLAVSTPAALSVDDVATWPGCPLMIKSRHNRRDDLVARLDGPEELRETAVRWPHEPVVVQEFTANSGWDHKLWVVQGRVFSALRPAAVGGDAARPLPAPVVASTPAAWRELALRTGAALGLQVYGVDILDRAGDPLIVDVNAFPGIRGRHGAAQALAALAVGAGPRTDARA